MIETLIDIQTTVSILSVARRAHANVTAFRIHTLVLTIVRAYGTLVHIATRPSITVEFVTWGAPALEGTKGIVALVFARSWSLAALINVFTTCSTWIRLVAPLADAPVRAQGVDAGAMLTQSRHCAALINVSSIRS